MNSQNPFLKIRARTFIYWSIAAFFLVFLFAFVIGIIIGIASPQTQSSNLNLNAATELILGSVFTYGIIWLWCRNQGEISSLNWGYLFGRLPRLRDWLPLLILNIPILFFSLGTGQILFYTLYFYKPQLLESILRSSSIVDRSLGYNLIYFCVLVIAAPLFEEIFFRGFIFQRLAIKWGNSKAIIISSIIFGLLHLNPIGLFLFSIVMTLAYIKTRCLWVPILMHALNNLAAVLMSWYAITDVRGGSIDLDSFQDAWQSGLICIALALPLLILFMYKNWVKKQQPIPYLENYR